MKKQIIKKTFVRLFIVVAVLTLLTAFIAPSNSKAATINELRAQNNALQQQINEGNQKAKELANLADSLQKQLSVLNLQISQLQAQIDLTKGKINELQLSLDKAQKELDHQKELLKASMKELYKKGGASTVELLVGSDSFSQFINDQTYLETLKSGIQKSAQKVVALKQQIQAQKAEQQKLLDQQQGQQNALVSTQQQQQNLLAQTQGQEASYRQMVGDLRQKQLALLAQIASSFQQLSGDGTRGGYPTVWANAPQDTIVDTWGMFNRECVSYAAFKVAQSGRHMPWWGYRGNAADWTDNAYASGIPVYSDPQPGDVAISKAGGYGHAMYVEAVSGSSIYVSQYNVIHGQYSEMWVNLNSTGWLGTLYYIRFP